MKWLLSLRASGRLSAAGDRITALLLSTVNGQRLGNRPTAGLSLRTGKLRTEISALESLRHKLSFGMVISCSTVNRNSL
jgi:hypothetical protein